LLAVETSSTNRNSPNFYSYIAYKVQTRSSYK